MSKKNRIIVEQLAPGRFVLNDAESRYATRVRRMRDGEICEVIDPWAATQANARLSVRGREVSVDVTNVSAGERLGFPGVALVQALGKGDKAEQVLRSAVALGASEITFVESARSVPRRANKHEAGGARWQSLVLDTVRQCGRSNLPVVRGPLAFGEMIAEAARGAGANVVLHPRQGTEPLLAVVDQLLAAAPMGRFSADHPLRLWVGPEGGLSEDELSHLDSSGARRADLGPLVLRTELAAIAALASVGAHLHRNAGPNSTALAQTASALLEQNRDR